MKLPPDKDVFTQDDLAALLGVHRNTIFNLQRRGELPPRLLVTGRTARYSRIAVERWLAGQRAAA